MSKFYFLPVELGISDNTLFWQVNLAEKVALESNDLETVFAESRELFKSNKEKNLEFENPFVWDYVFNGNGDGLSYLRETLGRDSPAVFWSIAGPAIKNDPLETMMVLEKSYPNLVTICLNENDNFVLYQRSL